MRRGAFQLDLEHAAGTQDRQNFMQFRHVMDLPQFRQRVFGDDRRDSCHPFQIGIMNADDPTVGGEMDVQFDSVNCGPSPADRYGIINVTTL